MSQAKHVVICGAGVIGLCVAHYLQQRGHRVTVIERAPPGREGCSFGNAGMIVPSHFIPLAAPGMVGKGLKHCLNSKSPFYLRPRLDADLIGWCWKFFRASTVDHVARSAPLLRDLSLASRAQFEELAAATKNDFWLTTRGLLMLCRTRAAFEHEAAVAEQAVRLGVPAKILSAKDAAALDPGVQMDIAGAVHFPLDCHLTPQRFMASLLERVKNGGATLRWGHEIRQWRVENERVKAALTTQGAVEADEFVLAGGSWSPATVRDLQVNLPLQPGKGYSLTLPAPRRLPSLCSILAEASVAVTPMGSSLRVGGTMELGGFDDRVRPERLQQITEALPQYFPEFKAADFRDVPVWYGYRPCSPDGLPYVGRFQRYTNLTAATGHAMMGLSLAPVTGRLVAEIISGERPSIAIDALRPDRFA